MFARRHGHPRCLGDLPQLPRIVLKPSPSRPAGGGWATSWVGCSTTRSVLDVLAEIEIRPQLEVVDLPDHKERIGRGDVERTRVRLCLCEERDEEIRLFLETEERPGRQLATIWWDH